MAAWTYFRSGRHNIKKAETEAGLGDIESESRCVREGPDKLVWRSSLAAPVRFGGRCYVNSNSSA